MTKTDILRIIRLADLYKIKNINLHKEIGKSGLLIKTNFEIINKFINREVEKRIKRAINIAKRKASLSNKKSYLKYLK